MAGSGTRVKGRTGVRKASIAVAAGAVMAVTFAIPAAAQDSELSGDLHWRTLAGAGSYTDVGPIVAQRFMELHPGVTITHENTPGDAYTEAMYTSAATGRTPDIFFSHSGWTQTFADRGVSLNLNPFFEAESDFTLDDWNQALLLAGTTVDMGSAAAGEAHVLGMSSDVWTVICNLDMLAEAGYDGIPDTSWTFEDLQEVARATTVRDDSGNVTRWGFGAANDVADVIQNAIVSAGGTWLDEETQTLPVTPEFIEGIRNVWDPIKEGIYMSVEDLDVLGGGAPEQPFLNEQLACMQGAIWSTPQIVDATFPWDVTTMPTGPGGSFAGGGTAGWSIAADSEHPDVAWELMKFIFAPEQYELWTSAKSVVPPLTSLADSDWAPDVPNADRFLTAAENLIMLPRGPVFDSDEIFTALPDAYNKYVVQDLPLEEVLADLKAEIDAALAEKPAVVVSVPVGATSTDG